MMPDIKIDITTILEHYLIPIVICFTVGLTFYLTVFHEEWGWPTVIGCILFLIIQAGIWMKGNYDRNKRIALSQQQEEAIILQEQRKKEMEIQEAAKIFLHSCLNTAVGLYKHPRHPGEKVTERYVAFGEAPGYQYVLELSQYELDYWNQKFHFLYSDNGMVFHTGSPTHIVFHPVFHELVEKYLETGKIEFS